MTAVLGVTATASQPLAVGISSEVSYFTGSHMFVPGSVLRGALAAVWIAENGPPTAGSPEAATFRRLFDGDIRFGPLYPTNVERVPLSVCRCKYPTSDACRAFVVDRAFETAEFCRCGERLEASKGQLRRTDGAKEPPAMDRMIRTSIDPETMRAKDGDLYAHAAIPAGTVLTGTVFGRDEWLERSRTLRLGGRRTVGGAAGYQATPQAAELAPRVDVLVLRLTGPAIFVDAAGRARRDPDPGMDLPDGVTQTGAWQRGTRWHGWHAASRLPKPSEACAMPGSTYRYEGNSEALHVFAQRVLDEGLGLRRTEGFGVASVVTQPWRPRPSPAVVAPKGEEPRIHQRLRDLRDLRLEAVERAWLEGALRGLLIEQLRGGVRQPDALGQLLDDLFKQPTAAGLHGTQREGIRKALTDLEPAELRDLTTLLASIRADGVGAGTRR